MDSLSRNPNRIISDIADNDLQTLLIGKTLITWFEFNYLAELSTLPVISIFVPTRKIIIKAFGSIFCVLYCPFYEAFFLWWMIVMFSILESTCLCILCTTICWNIVLSIPFNQRLYKLLFSYKYVPFKGAANTKDSLISWLNSNP